MPCFTNFEQSRRTVMSLFAVLIAILIYLATAASALASPVALDETFAGADRYQTAGLIDSRYISDAQAEGDTVSGVILVAGTMFPDALVSSSLSGVFDYPVMLTDPVTLSPAAEDIIADASVTQVIIVGGTPSVSSDVESRVKAIVDDHRRLAGMDLSGDVIRYAGVDRISTSEEVFRSQSGSDGASWGWGDTVLVCSSLNFPDAASLSPLAARSTYPILLVDAQQRLRDTTKALIADAVDAGHVKRFIIAGDANAVSVETQRYLEGLLGEDAVVRLGGINRYETSALIAGWCVENAGFTYADVALASGNSFADALTGAPLQAQSSSVMLLVADYTTPYQTLMEDGSLVSARVFGDWRAVSPAIRAELVHGSKLTAQQYALYVDAAGYGYDLRDSSAGGQIVFVQSFGSDATVSFYERGSDSLFVPSSWVSPASGYVGREGVSLEVSEGSACTPAGYWDIPFSFGTASDPGSGLAYHRADEGSWWISDSDDWRYNTWIEDEDYYDDVSEHLIDMTTAYEYAVVIGYNHPAYMTPSGAAVPGAGSAFFFHVETGGPTSGCVSVPHDTMVCALRWFVASRSPHMLIV